VPQKQVHCLCKCVVSMAQFIAAGPRHEARLAAEKVQCGQGRVSATRPWWGGGSPPPSPPHTHMQNMKKHPGPGTQGRPLLQSAASCGGPTRPGVGCTCRGGNAAGGRGGEGPRVPCGPTASRRRREGGSWEGKKEISRKVGLSFLRLPAEWNPLDYASVQSGLGDWLIWIMKAILG
jgi:hypothetical protein